MVYLWLAALFDVGGLLTLLGGTQPHEGFDSPLLKSRGFRDGWGERWNLVIHRSLKTTVYKPLRSIGLGSLPAQARHTHTPHTPHTAYLAASLHTFPYLPPQLATFAASGLVHEYTFSIHNAPHNVFGAALSFFAIMVRMQSINRRCSAAYCVARRSPSSPSWCACIPILVLVLLPSTT